jgi:hypothetical protein
MVSQQSLNPLLNYGHQNSGIFPQNSGIFPQNSGIFPQNSGFFQAQPVSGLFPAPVPTFGSSFPVTNGFLPISSPNLSYYPQNVVLGQPMPNHQNTTAGFRNF